MEILKDYFETKGYNVVAMPKSNIRPLQLLSLEGKHLSSLGSTVDVLFEEDSSPMPSIKKDIIIPDLKGQSQLTLKINSGLTILNGLLNTLNLGNITTKANFSDSDKIVFSFDNIVEDGIDGFLNLDNFISGSIPNIDKFKTYKEKLLDSELYIITSVLKCNNFSVKLINKDSQNISAQIEIKDTIKADAELNRAKDNTIQISYKGKESLVFGFKAVQIIYDAPKWFEFWNKKEAGFKIKAQLGMVLKGIGDFPVKHLNLESDLVEI